MTDCRTCNDTGLIAAEHWPQPCPMCDAWERRMKAAVPAADDDAHARVSDRTTMVCRACGSRDVVTAKPGEVIVIDGHATPPSEWFELTIYLAIVTGAVLLIAALSGVWHG